MTSILPVDEHRCLRGYEHRLVQNKSLECYTAMLWKSYNDWITTGRRSAAYIELVDCLASDHKDLLKKYAYNILKDWFMYDLDENYWFEFIFGDLTKNFTPLEIPYLEVVFVHKTSPKSDFEFTLDEFFEKPEKSYYDEKDLFEEMCDELFQ